MHNDPRLRFLDLVGAALRAGTLVKLTLGKPGAAAEEGLQNLYARPVTLKVGPRIAFLWRYRTRDTTANHPSDQALTRIEALVGTTFLDAHLFTTDGGAQLECGPDPGEAPRLRMRRMQADPAAGARGPAAGNDRQKSRALPAGASWLEALGVLGPGGMPQPGMGDKYRQIQRYAELLGHLAAEAPLPSDRPLAVCDMGSGKGYLTFAAAELFGERARVTGVEVREPLVDFCNRAAAQAGLASRLSFRSGSIADAALEGLDILIALHACDTATDDALARGIALGAPLIVVAPCCQKELRPALVPPEVLGPALRHGIFLERHTEFVTDALRALLLAWCGYRTKVFEFISTEHTARNTMIAAVRGGPAHSRQAALEARTFAAFYGITHQGLADRMGFALTAEAPAPPAS